MLNLPLEKEYKDMQSKENVSSYLMSNVSWLRKSPTDLIHYNIKKQCHDRPC